MAFALVTDSSANLPNEIIDRYDLKICTLIFRVGDKEYISYEPGKENDLGQFYAMMRAGAVIKTSCVSPETVRATVEPLLAAGEDVLYLGFSSGLSATFATARTVLEDLGTQYPERQIRAVDTLAASLGQGLLVTYAAQRRAAGMGLDELADWVEAEKLHVCHWFTVDDLAYLKRGGRISPTAALLGTVLNIKPIMHTDDEGHLTPVNKVRSRKKAIDGLVEHMEASYRPEWGDIVYISHADALEDARYLEAQVRARCKVSELVIHAIDPVIGAHSGPGTLALFFMGTQR